jgi:hypothetical protein
MRILFILVFSLIFQSICFAQNDDFFKKADGFFKRYVTTTGKVRYDAIKEKPNLLNSLYAELNSTKPSEDDPSRFQAFYINAYNLAVIKTVVNNYPISSPMEVSGFFESVKHPVAGEKITLNHLENKILRKKFKEPRFHFVLVCGAVSCPPIVNFAYTPEMLNVQLEQQATLALNNPQFIRMQPSKKTVELSEIFKWYKEDFTNGQSVIEFLNQYRRDEIPSDYQIKYYTYNWMLNDINGPGVAAVDKAAEKEPNLNLQTYTAGTLLRKGQMDFTLFNTIYTETRNNWQGQVFDGYRATFATALAQWTVGVGKSGRFNIGFDLSLRGTGRASSNTSYAAVGQAFSFTNTDSTRFGIGTFGPRIKFSPFKGVNDFTVQSSFLFSPSEASEGRGSSADQNGLYWVEWDRYVWWNQFFYTYTFGDDYFQLFAEVDLLFRFARRDDQINHIDLPSSLFFSFFPTRKITLYAMTQYVPRFAGSPVYDDQGVDVTNDFVIGANYTASGLGFKYQFSPNLNIELLYTNFWAARNNGLGETFNLGIKYLVL